MPHPQRKRKAGLFAEISPGLKAEFRRLYPWRKSINTIVKYAIQQAILSHAEHKMKTIEEKQAYINELETQDAPR